MPILNADYSYITHEKMAASIGLDQKYIPRIIDSFVKETNSALKEITEFLANMDYDNIALAAHSIKGSAGNLSFTEIEDMAREMEFAAKDRISDFEYDSYAKAISKALESINI